MDIPGPRRHDSSAGERLAVLLRVFHRVEDALISLRIFGALHDRAGLHIEVASNGAADGYPFPAGSGEDELIELKDNPGLHRGDLALLEHGVKRLRELGFRYALLTQADSWFLDGEWLRHQAEEFQRTGAAWMSSAWDLAGQAATDMALADLDQLTALPGLFQLEEDVPLETHVFNLLDERGLWCEWTVFAPVHVNESRPRLEWDPAFAWNTAARRRNWFPGAKVITHHAEDLPGGLTTKLELAERMLGRPLPFRWERG
ncbi:MAG: hypothetical protein GMKNLPBB_03039 [Myxococcota bacterium]|nr:hypothetical protein [Myxococcota bacterium]